MLHPGYVLVGIAVVNWSVASHDISQVDFFTGQAALGGFSIFGKLLIYAIFAVTLVQSGDDEPVSTGLEERAPDAQGIGT